MRVAEVFKEVEDLSKVAVTATLKPDGSRLVPYQNVVGES